MSNADKRLDHLYPALSAQERATLTLLDSKEGREQDHRLRSTAPESQARVFNRLIDLIGAASGDLVHFILIHREKIAQTELKLTLLASLRVYAVACSRVRRHLIFDFREPVTQSVHDQRVQECRRELIPVRECADIVAARRGGSVDRLEADREQHSDAKTRSMQETVSQLRALSDDGTLVGRGKGTRLKIECGSFYDWLGEPVPVVADWGVEVEIFADDQRTEAEGLATRRTDVLTEMDRLAASAELPFDLEGPLREPPPTGTAGEEFQRMLAMTIRAEVLCHWTQLLTYELVVNEMTSKFDGEDVLQPAVREVVSEARATLIELREGLQRYTGPFDLPSEPDEETLAAIRRIINRDVRG